MHMLFSKALATQSFICYVCRKELQGSIELMRLIKQDFYYSFTFLGFILFQVTFNSYVGRLFFLTFKKKKINGQNSSLVLLSYLKQHIIEC